MWYKGFLGVRSFDLTFLQSPNSVTRTLQSPRIWTADPNVIQYILQHAYDYPKDEGECD